MVQETIDMQQPTKIEHAPSAAGTPSDAARYRPALAAATALFFMWGFLTALNDILIPHLKSVFELGYAGGAFVQLSFFSAYFLVSLPAGKVIAKVGYKRGILLGLAIAGVGALLFYPAASLPSYGFFLSALFVLASGIAFLQVAANPFVAGLGPKEGASSRLNLTQAFNSLGTTLAPFFGSYLFLASTGPRSKLVEAQAVRLPYVGLALTLFLLAGAVALFKLPRIESAEGDDDSGGHTIFDVLRVRHLVLGVLAIFLYVGAEVSIGSFMVSFLEQPAIGNMDAVTAARHVSFYWGGAMVGRFIGAVVLRKLDAGKVLAGCAAAAGALVVLALSTTGTLATWSLLAVGLCNSIMFPTIFTLAVDGLGKLTSRGSSLLVMAVVGGAVIPVLFGMVADRFSLQAALALPALCYVYIVFFGLRGARHDARRVDASVVPGAS
jgi:MFS transporter, FHS family, L-fucose permease